MGENAIKRSAIKRGMPEFYESLSKVGKFSQTTFRAHKLKFSHYFQRPEDVTADLSLRNTGLKN